MDPGERGDDPDDGAGCRALRVKQRHFRTPKVRTLCAAGILHDFWGTQLTSLSYLGGLAYMYIYHQMYRSSNVIPSDV